MRKQKDEEGWALGGGDEKVQGNGEAYLPPSDLGWAGPVRCCRI